MYHMNTNFDRRMAIISPKIASPAEFVFLAITPIIIPNKPVLRINDIEPASPNMGNRVAAMNTTARKALYVPCLIPINEIGAGDVKVSTTPIYCIFIPEINKKTERQLNRSHSIC